MKFDLTQTNQKAMKMKILKMFKSKSKLKSGHQILIQNGAAWNIQKENEDDDNYDKTYSLVTQNLNHYVEF